MSNTAKLEEIQGANDYRRPMKVTTKNCYRNGSGYSMYAICPKCAMSIEREFQSYCDRCGQALDWRGYSRALIIIK